MRKTKGAGSLRILLILTGGTICSRTESGNRRSDVHAAATVLEERYFAAHPDSDVQFTAEKPINRLSEDLTPEDWRTLLRTLAQTDLTAFSGILIAHGTDTLDQTAAMLSAALCGISVPVILVSAIAPPLDPQTNAHVNFAAAVQLLQQRLAGGVWAVYQNSDGVTYLHSGACLRRCTHGSTDFFSDTMQPVDAVLCADRIPAEKNTCFALQAMTCEKEICLVHPYTGMRYDTLPLDGIAAIVQETYHSETANAQTDSPYSVQTLLRRCRAAGIPCYLAPCTEAAQCYGSAHDLVAAGAIPLYMPSALAYGAVWVGCQCGLTGNALTDFVRQTAQRLSRLPFRCCM